MKTILPLMLLSSVLLPAAFPKASDAAQYYEIRSYVLGKNGDAEAVHTYLRSAWLPAMKRQSIGPIGVFTNSGQDQSGSDRVVVVIPYDSADAIQASKDKLADDSQYQKSAKTYLERGPEDSPYQRIESEMLVAMDCMPRLKVPADQLKNGDRVFEFRIYESANERLGNLKVHMFNNGEVPIFLDCGIQPIFIGQAVIGPYTPNLSYLTSYPNEVARKEAWGAFRSHEDWQVLKQVAKYQGTVSKIHKYVLVPTDYSKI